jgi:Ca2+/H+ antiporter
LNTRWITYMRSIYLRPCLAAVPVAFLTWFLKNRLLTGRSWAELATACAIIAIAYYGLGVFACIEESHRSFLAQRLAEHRRRLAATPVVP